MAPRRKPRSAGPEPGRELKMRVPADVADRIEAKAKAAFKPMNRVVVDELAEYPALERYRDFAIQLEEMKNTLARYSSHIVVAELSDEMMATVRDVLNANEAGNKGELLAKLAKLRVLFTAIEKQNRS